MMKRFLTLAAALLMMAGMTAFASAESAEYSSTRAFLSVLDNRGISYSFNGKTDNGEERVKIGYDGENGIEYDVYIYFGSNEKDCDMFVWEIISYRAADFGTVLRSCNTLNISFRQIRFYADESDNTVTASLELSSLDGNDGEMVLEALSRLCLALDKAYDYLEPLDNYVSLIQSEHMLSLMNRRGIVEHNVHGYVEYEGNEYAVLLPTQNDEDGIVILCKTILEDGRTTYNFMDDQAVMQAVFDVFKEQQAVGAKE